MNPFENLIHHLKGLEEDFTKFYEKGNKTAGIRVRKGMIKLKEMAQEIRKGVQEMKNDGNPS
jgi:hypothetical protein